MVPPSGVDIDRRDAPIARGARGRASRRNLDLDDYAPAEGGEVLGATR
jgi:hypothetical protein